MNGKTVLKNMAKKLSMVIAILAIVLGLTSNVKAANFVESKQAEVDSKCVAKVASIMDTGRAFIEEGSRQGGKSADDYAEEFLEIGRILAGIAEIVLLGCIIVIGMKWATATPDKKAQLKQQLIGLVISAAVVFGAVGIWELSRNILSQAFGG